MQMQSDRAGQRPRNPKLGLSLLNHPFFLIVVALWSLMLGTLHQVLDSRPGA